MSTIRVAISVPEICSIIKMNQKSPRRSPSSCIPEIRELSPNASTLISRTVEKIGALPTNLVGSQPECIFERSVEHTAIIDTERSSLCNNKQISIFQNLSTINADDLYNNSFDENTTEKNKSDSDREFLLHYPLIKPRMKDHAKIDNATSIRHKNKDPTTSNHKDINKQGKDRVKKQCSPDVSRTLQGRILERLQEARNRGNAGICHSTGLSSDKNRNPVKPNTAKSETSINSGENRAVESSLTVDTSILVERREMSGVSSGINPMKTADTQEHINSIEFPNKKLKSTHVYEKGVTNISKAEAAERFKNIDPANNKFSSFEYSTFQTSCSSSRGNREEIGSANESSVEQSIHDEIREKENKRKKIRRWIKNRSSCWSKQKEEEEKTGIVGKKQTEVKSNDVSCRCSNSPPDVARLEQSARRSSSVDAKNVLGDKLPSSKSRPSRLRPRSYRYVTLCRINVNAVLLL